MAAEVAAFISEFQPVAQRFLRTLNRDLAGRGAALLALFALFLAVASWLSDDRRPRSAWQELGLVADGPALRRVYVREAEDLEALFAEHDYSLSALDTGVPRLATTALPRDMARVDDPEARKALFLRTLLPLVLQAKAELRQARGEVMAAEWKSKRLQSSHECDSRMP